MGKIFFGQNGAQIAKDVTTVQQADLSWEYLDNNIPKDLYLMAGVEQQYDFNNAKEFLMQNDFDVRLIAIDKDYDAEALVEYLVTSHRARLSYLVFYDESGDADLDVFREIV